MISDVDEHIFESCISLKRMVETMIQTETIRTALPEGTGGKVFMMAACLVVGKKNNGYNNVDLIRNNRNLKPYFLQVPSITNNPASCTSILKVFRILFDQNN